MKIGLDAGHGLNTPGKRTPDGIREWTLNNAVCNYIAENLKEYADILRLDDVTGSNDISLTERRKKAVNNCDVLVSTHHNALKDDEFSTVTGIEVYVHTNIRNNKANDLADMIALKLSTNTGLKNRGVKNAKFTVIATDEIPAVLCEGGFMDGEKDSYYIRTSEGQKAYAKAVSDSIIEFFNLVKAEEVKEEFNVAKTYKNGSTPEPVYSESSLKTKTGSLNKYEVCECLDIVNGVYLVKYKQDGTNAYKTGFVKYSGEVK